MRNNAAKPRVRSALPATGDDSALGALGITPLPATISEVVPVRRMLGDAAAFATLARRMRRYRQAGLRICLAVTDIGQAADAGETWRTFCERLRDAARPGGPGFAIRSHCLPAATFCGVPDRVFGHGPRFLFLDSLQMQPSSGAPAAIVTRENWIALRDRRRRGGPLPAYGGFVRSTCPLLSDEVAVEILPGSGLVVPAGSAWQCLSLPLTALCGRRGDVADGALGRIAADAVGFADDLIDRYRWPDEGRRADAARNRRLAFILTGIGDVVQQQGLDPRDFGTLGRLSGLLRRVRHAFRAASRRLADERGSILSQDEACPASGWFDGAVGESWSRRFEAARNRSLVRHRNLLAMSPYAVLPGGEPPPAFADLLPLIALADAWCFSGVPSFDGWKSRQFRDFHRRARAVIQQSQGHSRVAGGV